MKPYLLALFLIFSSLFSEEPISYEFNFSKSAQGWVGGFADYPVGEEPFYELGWGWENLPTAIPTHLGFLTKGLFLSGNNHSDDLFMFVRRQIVGLEPNTYYSLTFSLLIESNVPSSEFGVGGSPGESVYVKVGASEEKPKKVNHSGYYLLNVDKGSQSQEGENALMIGNLANPAVDPKHPHYLPKQLTNDKPLIAKSDANGRLWIFLGTDSGFEGTTKFYIADVTVTFHY